VEREPAHQPDLDPAPLAQLDDPERLAERVAQRPRPGRLGRSGRRRRRPRRVRRALREGSEDDRLYWIARILREAQYADVWQYVALRRDVLPRWELLRPRLGRRRAFWEFLLDRWRSDGLLS
jgi:hypothetical protein